jgi:glycosyltransferase involved in cell wall biosynthesis
MVDDGKTGIIVPPCDVNALAEAIIGLLDDKSKIDSMSHNIKQEAELGKGAWSLIADEYIKVYSL